MKKKIRNFPTFVRSLEHPQPPSSFSFSDVLFLLLFLFIGFFSRTFRLNFPPNRVFDEVHFGGFTNKYLTNTYFHDIHPPLGKLLLALYGYLSGYDGTIDFQKDAFTNKHYFTLRSVPATFSALIPPVSFLTMRIFGYSLLSSITVAMFLTAESMLIVESHLILIDGFLHSITVLTILGVSLLDFSPYSNFAMIFTAFMAGCTYSIKYTGLSVLAFVGAHQVIFYSKSRLLVLFKFNFEQAKTSFKSFLIELFDSPLFKIAMKMLIILTISFSIMYFTFVIHIIILDNFSNDANFMPHIFRTTLITPGKPKSVRTCCMSMRNRVNALIKAMHRSNMGIKSTHSASSKWHEWPFVQMKMISYYTNNYSLILFATPLIWYAAAIGPIICLLLAGFAYFYGNSSATKLIIWPTGYYASWVPFVLIPRVLFVYHYLVPLIFGVFSFVAAIDVILSGMRVARSAVLVILVATCAGIYVFYAPWMYGMKGYDWGVRKWYKKMF